MNETIAELISKSLVTQKLQFHNAQTYSTVNLLRVIGWKVVKLFE